MQGLRTPTQAREGECKGNTEHTSKALPCPVTIWNSHSACKPNPFFKRQNLGEMPVIPKLYTEQTNSPRIISFAVFTCQKEFHTFQAAGKSVTFPCELYKPFIKICLRIRTPHRLQFILSYGNFLHKS